MASVVYLLCTFASALCAVLLLRQFFAARMRLLLWSSLSFAAMTLGNALVFVDLVILPGIDLSLLRAAMMFAAAALLLYGLIGEGD